MRRETMRQLVQDGLDLCEEGERIDRITRDHMRRIGNLEHGTRSFTPIMALERQHDEKLNRWKDRAKRALETVDLE